jgi:AcrR family transcriptional regulator
LKGRRNDSSTEEKILKAARQVFIEKGLSGARMQDIADKAEINKAMLHYYFKSKEMLFEVIFRETAGKLFPHFEKLMDSDLNFFDKIRSIVSSYIEVIIQNPYIPLFVMNEMNKNPEIGMKTFFEAQKSGFVKKLREAIEENVREGQILSINPIHLIMNMFSLCAFPFIAKPLIQLLTSVEEEQFAHLMDQRKVLVAEFIINSIRK